MTTQAKKPKKKKVKAMSLAEMYGIKDEINEMKEIPTQELKNLASAFQGLLKELGIDEEKLMEQYQNEVGFDGKSDAFPDEPHVLQNHAYKYHQMIDKFIRNFC